MSTRDDHIGAVFSALSDATRRSVLGQVSRTESITATELADTLPVSRQAVVKHLQVLGRAGLVTSAATAVRCGTRSRPHRSPTPRNGSSRKVRTGTTASIVSAVRSNAADDPLTQPVR